MGGAKWRAMAGWSVSDDGCTGEDTRRVWRVLASKARQGFAILFVMAFTMHKSSAWAAKVKDLHLELMG